MDTISAKSNNIRNGLVFGLVIGLVYCISIFLRFNMISSGPIMVGAITLLFYIVVIGMLVFCGLKRRKELGGFIDLKDAFQTIFVAVLVGELIYLIFNFIYLTYIDPNYFDKFMNSMQTFMEKSRLSEDKKDEMMDRIRKQMEAQRQKGMTIGGIALGYCISVAITGIFGFIAALVIRKRKPVFDTPNNQF